MRQALPSDTTWDLVHHDGLAPTQDLGDKDALWIDPGLLIAQNAWLESLGRPPVTPVSYTHLTLPTKRIV